MHRDELHCRDGQICRITLNNTGETIARDRPALIRPGLPDPNWTVALGPPGYSAGPAWVLIEPQTGHPASDDPSGASQRIWMGQYGTMGQPGDCYTFRYIVDLTDFDVSTVEIEVGWSVAYAGALRVAGIELQSIRGEGWANFRISEDVLKPLGGVLHKGMNAIDFAVLRPPASGDGHARPGWLDARLSGYGRLSFPELEIVPHSKRSTGLVSSVIGRVRFAPFGRAFQHLSVQLPRTITRAEFDKTAVMVQPINLEHEENGVPHGIKNVYKNILMNIPMSTQILGFDEDEDGNHTRVFLRVWRPAEVDPSTGLPDAERSGCGDPETFPSSGVVVVVNTGGTMDPGHP